MFKITISINHLLKVSYGICINMSQWYKATTLKKRGDSNKKTSFNRWNKY